MSDVLLVKEVVKILNSKTILNGITLRVSSGEIYGLLGPNGAGKSTLMNIVSGLLKPDRGRVLVYGEPPESPSVKRVIGYCPQDPCLINSLSGLDNALFYGRLYGLARRDIVEKTISYSERLGLSKRDLEMKIGKYSGGMKKKLSLVITLLHDPKLLILDEPTTGMDPNARIEVWDLVMELKNNGRTIMLATHYMEEADRLSDRVGIMYQGRIIAEDVPEALKRNYGPKTTVLLELEKTPGDHVLKLLKDYGEVYMVDDTSLKVHLEDPERKIPEIMSSLCALGCSVLGFKIAKPTLEDVFTRLTGRRLVE